MIHAKIVRRFIAAAVAQLCSTLRPQDLEPRVASREGKSIGHWDKRSVLGKELIDRCNPVAVPQF